MAKENKSKYAVMGVLSICPASGYDIKKFMECSTSNFWNESYGQIYPILKQLVEEGLAARHAEKQEGKPEKYIYTLTEQGKEGLRDWLSESVESGVDRNELLLKLFLVPISRLRRTRSMSTPFRSFSRTCSKNTKVSSASWWLQFKMMRPSRIT